MNQVVTTLADVEAHPFAPQDDLIVDLGMHVGQDTDFYLKKGFDVVAVEANPVLAEAGAARFRSEIEAGRLVVANLGVAEQAGRFPFYVNQVLSEWSSFDRDVASRGHPVEEVVVETVTIRDLLGAFGVPYYLKVDIEAYDHFAISGLAGVSPLPRYVSVENGGPAIFAALESLGYTHFKFLNQARVAEMACPVPAREGLSVPHTFPFGATGPFGEDTPGRWRAGDEMRRQLEPHWQRVATGQHDAAVDGWFDLHARRPAEPPDVAASPGANAG